MPRARIITTMMTMIMTIATAEAALDDAGLYRLLAWLSPGFPIGSFSYSHGLEAAAENGIVRDRDSLQGWIGAVVAQGSGRIDADILCCAHRAAAAGDLEALCAVNRRGLAYRATAELANETTAQGAAFLAACRAAWPDELIARWAVASLDRPHPDPPPPAREGSEGAAALQSRMGEGACYPAAVGAAVARARIAVRPALVAYLQAMAANLMSAGLRLGIVGQTDGQRILAALEPAVLQAAGAAIARGPAGFGAATFAADLASMAHETQYTRLFRS
jgi:urease accessory protein